MEFDAEELEAMIADNKSGRTTDPEKRLVLKFISNFAVGSCKDVFTSGCCWWFAEMLLHRFGKSRAEIMYSQIDNHFGTMILGRVYDVTGDVTDEYEWEPFSKIIEEDPLLFKRLFRDCIAI